VSEIQKFVMGLTVVRRDDRVSLTLLYILPVLKLRGVKSAMSRVLYFVKRSAYPLPRFHVSEDHIT
jgi:hypothetical protein